MPNKTVYLRDGEEPTWERAKRIAELKGENISVVIMVGLKQYVEANSKVADKIEEIRRSGNV